MVMRTSTELHTYTRGERTAKVFDGYEGFFVEFYVNDKLVKTQNVFGHSETYAENTAENWVDEIIQLNG